MHREGTERSEEGKVIRGSAEPLYGESVKDMIGSAKENAEPRECLRGERKPCLNGFCYKRAVSGNEAVDCAVLRKMSLTAREVLSDRALNSKLDDLEKQERRKREELANRSEKLERELGATKKPFQGLGRLWVGTGRVETRSVKRWKEEAIVVAGESQDRMAAQT